MKIKRIAVRSAAGPYMVVCGSGAIRLAAKEIRKLGKFSSVHVISSAKVWRAVGKMVRRGLGASRKRTSPRMWSNCCLPGVLG